MLHLGNFYRRLCVRRNGESDGAQMNFISLFSGIGGFDLGLERAGMTCRAQVEIDKAARGVLAAHWPDVERITDVTKAGKHNLPAVELICGGFPCQDVSIAGRRAGLDGERSGLWFEFARIVDELKPQWVLIENVPGLLSSNAGQDFKVILGGLVKFGYGVCWRILDAQYFGVAQRRRRLFIVASLGTGRSAQVLFERESGSGDTAQSEETRETIAKTLTGRSVDRFNATDTAMIVETFTKQRSDQYGTASVEPTLAARDYKDNGDLVVASTLTTEEGLRSPRGDSSDNLILAFSPQASMAGHDSSIVRIGDKRGALQVSKREGVLNMQGVRRLTPVECERLQGFPDQWTAISSGKSQADSARYKQLGNAVAVPVVEWIARRIMEVQS